MISGEAIETSNNIWAIMVPEEIWANNYVASAIMTGTWSEKTQYIEDANISTISNMGETGNIEATIGINTTSTEWGQLTTDIKKNATGATIYSIVQIPEDQLAKLTLIRGLMRAVPWQHVDPPEQNIGEWIEGIGKAIVCALQEAYRALINILSATMNTAVKTLKGIASALYDGVRMLVAGIMAVVDFVIKFFKDLALLLWEFGQWFIGVLQTAINSIKETLGLILKAIAWANMLFYIAALTIMKKIIERITQGNQTAHPTDKGILSIQITANNRELENNNHQRTTHLRGTQHRTTSINGNDRNRW